MHQTVRMDLTQRPFEHTIGERDLAHWDTPVGQWLARRVLWRTRWAAWRWVALGLALVGFAVALLGAWAVAEVYQSIVRRGGFAPLDQSLLRWAVNHRPAWASQAVTWFTHIGGPVVSPIVAVVVLGGLTWRWRTPTPIVVGALAGVGSLAITIGGKLAVGRDRPSTAFAVPPYEHSHSFPSGHAMNAVVIAGVIAYVFLTRESRRSTMIITIAAAVVYALSMGFSRVYLGHHWMSDVTAGWALGLVWLAVVITGHRLQLTHHRYHEQLESEGTPDEGPVAPRNPKELPLP